MDRWWQVTQYSRFKYYLVVGVYHEATFKAPVSYGPFVRRWVARVLAWCLSKIWRRRPPALHDVRVYGSNSLEVDLYVGPDYQRYRAWPAEVHLRQKGVTC